MGEAYLSGRRDQDHTARWFRSDQDPKRERHGNTSYLSPVSKSWKVPVCCVLYQRPRTKDRGKKEQHDQRHAL